MSRDRIGNVVLEPVPVRALTADEARDQMTVLESLIGRPAFGRKASVTVRCFGNELMTREYAYELFNLITGEYGVPRARFIHPTFDAASYLVDAAADAGKPESLELYFADGARTSSRACRTLADYLAAAGV
jgi:hypothetical protein